MNYFELWNLKNKKVLVCCYAVFDKPTYYFGESIAINLKEKVKDLFVCLIEKYIYRIEKHTFCKLLIFWLLILLNFVKTHFSYLQMCQSVKTKNIR